MNLFRRLQNELTLSKIKRYEKIEGFLAPLEAITLYRLASLLTPSSTVVEIGSWKGKSTYCLAQGLKNGKVIAIDPFNAFGEDGSNILYENLKGQKELINQFKEEMQRAKVMKKIEIFCGYSHEFVGKIPKIDLLFIDGDHSKEGCSFDFVHYSPFINPGGYIALHDYYQSRKDLGPTWVVENKILPYKEYEFIELAGSLWIGRKL
jgi:predicted O-methyltransferase YrrM